MITIVSYRSEWPAEFKKIGEHLRTELGALALRIDHIGSTSIPGLAAKDRIDIQVTVVELSEAVEQALNRAGFTRNPRITGDHLPPGSGDALEHWSKWLFGPAESARPVNLHVRIQGYPNQRYPLLFRDYLRAHPHSAEAYARVKQELARYHADDIEAYCDIKDPVCDLIIFAAEAWAGESGWQPGPSDC
jgi:GrpB-like predicted nucleotidyltransferase (UPF0157 family)